MASDFRTRPRGGRLIVGLAAMAVLALGASPAMAKESAGTLTSRSAMVDVLAPGGSALPLITVGESIGGYTFEAIPDGISVWN